MTAADSLVHDNAQRQAGLEDNSVLGLEGDFARVAHCEEYAGGAELVDVMVDVVCPQAGQVGDGECRVERAGIDDLCRKESVLVHFFEQPDTESGKSGERQKLLDELVGGVLVLGLAVFLDVAVHLLVDGEDVVFLIEADLAHCAFHVAVLILEDNHGAVDSVALVDLAVDDEAVEKREMGNRPQVSCDYDRQVADILALCPLGLDVILDGINRESRLIMFIAS